MKKPLLFIALLCGALSFAQMRMIPHLTRPSGLFSSELILANESNQAADYRLIPYLEDGTQMDVVSGTLMGGETLFATPFDLFSSDLISHFLVESETVFVTVAYRDAKAEFSPAHVRESNQSAQRWRIYPATEDDAADGLAMVNVDDAAQIVEVHQYSRDGRLVQAVTPFANGLASQAKGLFLFDDNFSRQPDTYFEVVADGPLALTALRFATGSQRYFWQTGATPMAPRVDESDPVGSVAVLETFHHGVSGSVTIVDDRTLRIDNFFYDGLGPDVYVYVAMNKQFSQGLAVSPELASTPYEDATVVVDLPDGVTLADFNSVSIWCRQFSSDFGSGYFE